jgi:hypothetical protein
VTSALTVIDARGALPFAVEYRELDASTIGFVYDSWLKSLHDGSPALRSMAFARYKPTQKSIIARCVERGAVVVALDPNDGGERRTVYGWACASDDSGVGVLHYAYVVQTRRRVGLGRELVRMAGAACGRQPEQYSHSTITGGRFAGRLRAPDNARLSYNPFAILRMVAQCA